MTTKSEKQKWIESLDPMQMLFATAYNPSDKFPVTQEVTVSIVEDQITGSTKEIGIISPGSLTAIGGTTGVGKTTFSHMITASVISGHCHMLKFTGDPSRRKVLYINTEMSRRDEFYSFKRGLERFLLDSGIESSRGHLYGLNLLEHCVTVQEKQDTFFRLLQLLSTGDDLIFPPYNGVPRSIPLSQVGLIIVDNVADVVDDVHEDVHIYNFIQQLQALVGKLDMGMITLAHTTATGNKLANRFGTILVQKVGCGIMLKRKGEDPSEPVTIFNWQKNRFGGVFKPLTLEYQDDKAVLLPKYPVDNPISLHRNSFIPRPESVPSTKVDANEL